MCYRRSCMMLRAPMFSVFSLRLQSPKCTEKKTHSDLVEIVRKINRSSGVSAKIQASLSLSLKYASRKTSSWKAIFDIFSHFFFFSSIQDWLKLKVTTSFLLFIFASSVFLSLKAKKNYHKIRNFSRVWLKQRRSESGKRRRRERTCLLRRQWNNNNGTTS